MESKINTMHGDFLKGWLRHNNLIGRNIEVLIFMVVLIYKCILFNVLASIKYNSLLFFAASLGSILFFAGIAMWFKRSTRLVILLAFDIVATAVIIADIIFYSYFNDVISAPVLLQIAVVDSLESSITNLFKAVELLFVVDVFVFVPLVVRLVRKKKMVDVLPKEKRYTGASAAMLASVVLVSFGFLGIGKMTGRNMNVTILDHTMVVRNAGILNFHAGDTFYFLLDKITGGKSLPNPEKDKIKRELDSVRHTDINSKLKGIAKGKNLIVIQVEAMQNQIIGMEVNGREVTPNLNAFIKKSAYFNNYYSQTASGGTSDAEFISNNSYYPLAEGALYYQYAENTFESMPSVLKGKGYNTMVMHAYRPNFWNREKIYPALGFQKFVNEINLNIDEKIAWGLSDKSFFKQSLVQLQKARKPFYSFMITLSSHFPYEAFEESTDFDAAEFNHTFFGNYLKAMHYADSALGQFLNDLEKNNLMDLSVIAIYGDHAGIQKKELDEGIKSFLKLSDNDDLNALQMKKVPLIIHLPGDREAGLREKTGGQLDLFPTLANLLDIKARFAMGKDLFSDKSNNLTVLRDGSVTDSKTMYIKRLDRCFDIESGLEIPKDEFKAEIDYAFNQLQLSDNIIKNNLIQYFKQKGLLQN